MLHPPPSLPHSGATCIDVLLLEDDVVSASRIEHLLLDSAPEPIAFTRATLLSEAHALLAERRPSVIVLALSLADPVGLAAIVRTRELSEEAPIVLLAHRDEEGFALRAMEAGAQDYILREELASDALVRTIRRAIRRQQRVDGAERTRKEQERLKQQFLSHVSHELRSPLTAAHLLMTVVRDALTDTLDDEHREYVDVAIRNLGQLGGMIDDLLEVTRMESGQLRIEQRRIELAPIIAEILEPNRVRAAARGVSVSTRGLESAPPVFADPLRVRQVLTNLLDNAVKFCDDGGAVEIAVKDEGALVRVAVSDTGMGIVDEEREFIFGGMYQPHRDANGETRRGLGLGLRICRHIVERHGGEMRVDSIPSAGSTFSFALPSFSLRPLLAPLLATRPSADASVVLATVELVRPPHGMPPSAWRELSRTLRWIVQGAMAAGHELMLPPMGELSDRERIAVVAPAGKGGGDFLSARLLELLSGDPRLSAVNVSWAVRSMHLCANCSGEGATAGADDDLALMSEMIETILMEIPTRPRSHE